MKIALVAMLALVCAASTAEARPRHVAHQKYDPQCNVSMPCQIPAGASVSDRKETARRARGQ
jgi:hypothetical protein